MGWKENGMNTCSNCKFWKPGNQTLNTLGVMVPADHKDANPTGFCHRYPPLPVRGQTTGWRQFPTTIDDDSCGEWVQVERKEEPKPAAPIPAPAGEPAPAPVVQVAPPTPPKKKRWIK